MLLLPICQLKAGFTLNAKSRTKGSRWILVVLEKKLRCTYANYFFCEQTEETEILRSTVAVIEKILFSCLSKVKSGEN